MHVVKMFVHESIKETKGYGYALTEQVTIAREMKILETKLNLSKI